MLNKLRYSVATVSTTTTKQKTKQKKKKSDLVNKSEPDLCYKERLCACAKYLCVCVCVCACVRAFVRACVRACVHL